MLLGIISTVPGPSVPYCGDAHHYSGFINPSSGASHSHKHHTHPLPAPGHILCDNLYYRIYNEGKLTSVCLFLIYVCIP